MESVENSKSPNTNPFYHKETHQNSIKSTGSCSSPISYADVVKKLMLRNLKIDFLQLQVLHSTI